MKTALVVAIVLAFVICLVGRTNAEGESTNIANQATTNNSSVLSAFPEGEHDESGHSDNRESSSGDSRAQWILVILTGITAAFICWQALETKRAAQAAADNVAVIRRQADIMDAQKGILEQTVAATKDNAEAAKRGAEAAFNNIEVFISKERARLRIDVLPFDLADHINETRFVRFVISTHGSTSAFITDSGASAYYLPIDAKDVEGVADAVMFPIHDLPGTIAPNSPAIRTFSFLFLEDVATTLPEIESGRLIVGIRGFIKYKDVFDRDRRTSFRYSWSMRELFGLAKDISQGEWTKSGPPEDNEEV